MSNDMPSSNNPIIKLRNIVKLFKVKNQDVLVLKGIDLDINKGDFALIYGPSGCGKSTLLHVLLGLEPPTLGKAELMGSDLYELSENARAEVRNQKVGMVFQQQNWIRALSILENVSFPLSLQGVPKWKALSRAKDELTKVGLADWIEYKPTELSSGQQQKAALAMALVTDPDIIVADEPTGNLDHKSGIDLMNRFKQLCQEGKTVIMVTHDLENVEYANKIFLLFDGMLADTFSVSSSNIDAIKKKLIDTKNGSVSGKPASERELMVNARNAISRQNHEMARNRDNRRKENAKGWLAELISSPIKLASFSGVLLLNLAHRVVSRFFNLKWIAKSAIQKLRPFLTRIYLAVYNFFERSSNNSISRQDLIDISLENMMAKKSRTLVTVGGMAIAIGVIVFLVSIGYGLERLVVSRVVTLNEMRHIEVTSAPKSSVKLDDSSVAQLGAINGVEKVIPVISVAGNIEYQNSNADVVVYGVSSDYLSESSVGLVSGEIFDTGNENSAREAVVNQSFLRLIGVSPSQSIGETFSVSFVATYSDLPLDSGADGTSEEGVVGSDNPDDSDSDVFSLEYKIVGVTTDSESAMAYVPISALMQVGDETYSQAKVVVWSQSAFDNARKQIEALGFVTTAVSDTVAQVVGLFSTLRLGLWGLGMVALAVAGFGMFNTITVSLLERTREVGFMKAFGMKSTDVKELFLTESMTMGFLGGIAGILLGMAGGKFLSLIASIYTTSRGFGFIDIAFVPFLFVLVVLFISVGVGVITGRFPARRAERISALDALRYE